MKRLDPKHRLKGEGAHCSEEIGSKHERIAMKRLERSALQRRDWVPSIGSNSKEKEQKDK